MADSAHAVRRIVTASRPSGASYFAEDGPAPAAHFVPGRPDFCSTNVWVIADAPASIDAPDASRDHRGILPPLRGNILRVIDIPPEPADPEERRKQQAASFESLFKDAHRDGSPAKHPGMHLTHTIDYAIVLAGEIYAVMDEGETLMRAGDILIQRGTNHAWSNRSGKTCRIMFILIDGANA